MKQTILSVAATTALALALAAPTVAQASHGLALVNLSQKDVANGSATVAVGGVVTGTQVGFQVSSDSATFGSGYDYRVQFEVVPAGSAFTGTPTFSSSWQTNFKPSSSTKPYPQQNYTVPTSASAWRWQVREQTRSGSTIASTGVWTDFGSNGTNGDFVTNQSPVAQANGPYSGIQGQGVTLSAAGSSDPDGTLTSYEWDCTDNGSYDVVSVSTSAVCTYPDDGTYTARLRVTDDDGAQATDTATVNVPNIGPAAEANGPYTGTRGFGISLSAVGSSDSDGALVLYEWDCDTDGTYELSSNAATGQQCTYPAVGSYTATLRVTDDDGGQATDTASVTVGNDPPTADAGGPYAGNEGSPIALDGTASADVGGGSIVSWSWDCTDDGTYDVTASAGVGNACTYTDDGTFVVRLRVTDDDGATAEATASVTVGNLPPAFTSATGPSAGDEGQSLAFSASGTDPGAGDLSDLIFTWSWGDGTADSTGAAPSHSWADEGTYTVTIDLIDQDGGSASTTLSVAIANVAPTITSTPTTTANEATQWTYLPTAVDPGADTLVWSLSGSAPAAMTLDPATGALAWTPTYADVLAGPASAVLTVSDGDGGTDAQSFTLTLVVLDTDNDGLPDGWEDANGLDANDPSDAVGDPDGDGMTNLDELAEGTDPQSYDGPDAPVLTEPIGGAEIDSTRPDLLWSNANDPQGEALVYDVEVYEDAGLTLLAASVSGLAEDLSGSSTWKVDVTLSENGTYWWRARANDAWVAGPWATEEAFFVNEVNEAPETPTLVTPIGGETAASAAPALTWAEVSDVDNDAVTYDVEVYDEDGALVTSATDVIGDGTTGEWTTDATLVEDRSYSWTARAVDEHGLEGAWAPEEWFFFSTENAAPFGTLFVTPADQAMLENAPVLVASEGEDPEGTALEYRFEVDNTTSFDGVNAAEATVAASGTGTVEWDYAADGVVLAEDAWVYARVRAIDEGGVTSAPDTIAFFVRGTNDAPGVPVLLAPADGAEVGAAPTLEVEDPTDPEGDVVFIDFVVARDVELTDVVADASGVITGGGQTTWDVDTNLAGTLYWSARAVDADGAASAWAAPWRLEAPADEVPGDDDDDDDTEQPGCDCQSSVAGAPPSAGWALLLLLTPWVRRRRR